MMIHKVMNQKLSGYYSLFVKGNSTSCGRRYVDHGRVNYILYKVFTEDVHLGELVQLNTLYDFKKTFMDELRDLKNEIQRLKI